jgi:hypothetical protein
MMTTDPQQGFVPAVDVTERQSLNPLHFNLSLLLLLIALMAFLGINLVRKPSQRV